MQRLIFLVLFLPTGLLGQDDYPYPSLSPKGQIRQEVGNTLFEIEYERPAVRGRKIFGDLVPWNQVWRTGAGHCTKISFDRTVTISGQEISPGTYALFTIPNPDEWIVILNKDTTLYGSYEYDHRKDVVRLVLPSQPSGRFYESLTIDVEIIPNNLRVYISWEHTQVSFDIETSTDEEVWNFINEKLDGKDTFPSDTYAGAAEYCLYQNVNLLKGVKLAEEALRRDNNNGWARRVKIELLERLLLYEDALNEIARAIEIIKLREYEEEENRLWDIDFFTKYKNRIESRKK